MAIKPYRFEVAEARSFKHPHFPAIHKHTLLVPAEKLPNGIPNGANLRDPTGLNRSVYKDVRESLRGNEAIPGTFDLLNLGITIIAEEIRALDKRTFEVLIDDDFGIANGSHTAELIWACQNDATVAEGQHVEVKIITGLDGPNGHTLRVDIARAQNTSVIVKQQSIYELDGAFDSIKQAIKDYDWSTRVAYRESDDGGIDIRELISSLELINVVDFPNNGGKHPISAYEKWSSPLTKFGQDFKENRANPEQRTYAKLEPMLPEIMFLYDLIRHDSASVYRKIVKKGSFPKFFEKGAFEFWFANLPTTEKRLTKGAAYPILGAFRNYVHINRATGAAEWIGGFENVKRGWAVLGPILFREMLEATDRTGSAPDALGKNRNHWSNLHKTVRLHLMEQRLAGIEAEAASDA